MIRRTLRLIGLRISGCYTKATKKEGKRQANKATRKHKCDQEKYND